MKVFVKMRIGESRGYTAFRRDQLLKILDKRLEELGEDNLFDEIKVESD